MGWFFNRKDPKTELEGLERAQQILDERFKKGQVSNEVYMQQSRTFGERKAKCIEKLKKQGKYYDNY